MYNNKKVTSKNYLNTHVIKDNVPITNQKIMARKRETWRNSINEPKVHKNVQMKK